LLHDGHALAFSHCFSNGEAADLHSIRHMLESHGLAGALEVSEISSIQKFIDLPVEAVHSYAVLAPYAFALFEREACECAKIYDSQNKKSCLSQRAQVRRIG